MTNDNLMPTHMVLTIKLSYIDHPDTDDPFIDPILVA